MTTTAEGRWRKSTGCMGCDHLVACTAVTSCLDSPTDAARLDAVSRAVAYMSENLGQPQRLTDIAQAALLSPFHFHRVFRHITSTTPARFLAALRMAEARRLLLTTTMSVTEVCLAVGYSSLGTFIGQFSKFTGMSPRRFRVAMANLGALRLADLVDRGHGDTSQPGPFGTVTGGHREGGCAVIALFRDDSEVEQPAGYGVLQTNRVARMAPVANGTYRAVALGFDRLASLTEVFARPAIKADFLGTSTTPIVVSDGRASHAFHVALRRPRPIDPPVEVTPELLRLAGETLREKGCA